MQAFEGHAFLTIILLPPLHQREPLTLDHPGQTPNFLAFASFCPLTITAQQFCLTVTVMDKSPMISGINPLRERPAVVPLEG